MLSTSRLKPELVAVAQDQDAKSATENDKKNDAKKNQEMNGVNAQTEKASNDQQKQENDKPKVQEEEKEEKKEKEEEIVSGRLVPKDKIHDYMKDRINALMSMDVYENKKTLVNIRNICETYWNAQYKDRGKLGDIMCQNGFPDVVVKMLKFFNNEGLFKNDDIWFSAYYTLNTCWNFTDASILLAKDLAEKGLIKILVANIRHQPYLENISSKNVLYLVKASLSIIQNVAKCPEVKNIFDEEKTVEALKTFTTDSDDFLKTVSLMAMTALVSEAENATLTDTGAIPFMVRTIKFALKSAKRRHRGFTPEELTVSLGRMAVNDSNKMKIVNEGALPLFLLMLNHTDVEEQKATAGAIWNLSFDKDVREKIKADPKLIEALEKLAKNSDNDAVRKSCKGALWVLQEKNMESAAKMEDSEKAKSDGHIFISYNWGHQELVLKIVERLKNQGYKVWLDVDQMGGSTLEAMALGIENAKLVVICMSEKYKLSPNCRTEAEYTFQLKKPMLPLMMQRYYKPDGWLGMLLGAKFYINMDGKYPLDQAYPMMSKEMGRMFGVQGTDQVDSASAPQETFSAAAPFDPSMPYSAPAVALKDAEKVRKWTKGEVAEWIKKNELESLTEKFAKYDGCLLVQLMKLRHEAPEFYYKSLESKMDLDLTDILQLNAAFDTL